jgi:hypothetical protein
MRKSRRHLNYTITKQSVWPASQGRENAAHEEVQQLHAR